MAVTESYCGDFSAGVIGRPVRVKGVLNKSMKTCSIALRTSDWAGGLPSNMTTIISAQPWSTQDWIRDNSEWTRQSPDMTSGGTTK